MIYTLIGAALIVIGFFVLKSKPQIGGTKNISYTPKGDPNAQLAYEKMKFPTTASISMKELLELSWKFLYDLTETVLNKFSVRDQQEILQQGRVMVKNGMKYMHIVDSNPKVIEFYTKKAADRGKISSDVGRQ